MWLVRFLGAVIFLLAVVTDAQDASSDDSACLASAESTQSGLAAILSEVQRVYFHELHPEMIYNMKPESPENIRNLFRPYDPSPNAIKRRTDEATKLYRKLKALRINKKLLKLRERKAFHVASAILLNNAGWNPNNQDYYAGDWLLGPNLFCWEPVCDVFTNLDGVLPHFKPVTMADLEELKELLERYSPIFDRYVENWKLGARTGYIRPFKACQVGVHVLKNQKYKGMEKKEGIFDQAFAKTLLKSGFFGKLTTSVKDAWKAKYQKNVEDYFKQSILQNIATPVTQMIRYLEHEYLCNCPNQETKLSGLGGLPLKYVPIGGQRALHKLPTGEWLSGYKTYQRLMRFFTTKEITPARLRAKAVGRLDEMYRKAVNLAKLYTKERYKTTAINKFKKVLRNPDMWFNSQQFPSNENGNDAFIKCHDATSAQANCPERWKALQKWIKNTNNVMKTKIKPVIAPLFHRSSPKKTVPACPLEVIPEFHPFLSWHGYGVGSKDCKTKSSQSLPFFMDKFGPKWTEFTTTAHEQLPGHQLEVQSYVEYFQGSCTDAIHWLGDYNYFPGFTEGWTTYVEYELMPQDTNLYSDTSDKEVLLQKYGMIYYQILAALRIIVDIDLNYYKKTTSNALFAYKKYAWEDDTDQAHKDILRSQALPGIVASYMFGQMEISRVRDIAERELGRDFSLKDFHYEVLRQGEVPLGYLEEHIRAYIACKKNPALAECTEF